MVPSTLFLSGYAYHESFQSTNQDLDPAEAEIVRSRIWSREDSKGLQFRTLKVLPVVPLVNKLVSRALLFIWLGMRPIKSSLRFSIRRDKNLDNLKPCYLYK